MITFAAEQSTTMQKKNNHAVHIGVDLPSVF